MGPLHLAETVGHPRKGAIWLEVDGQSRQNGDLDEMIWSVEEVLAHLSGIDELLPGDLVFTGTPAGVGQVEPRQPDARRHRRPGRDRSHARGLSTAAPGRAAEAPALGSSSGALQHARAGMR